MRSLTGSQLVGDVNDLLSKLLGHKPKLEATGPPSIASFMYTKVQLERSLHKE